MTTIDRVKQRAFRETHEYATKSGKPPRQLGQHYFIERNGLHSRLHLQNFYSIFWPQVDEPAVAHIELFGADGARLGDVERTVARFGALFCDIRELLDEVGADAKEGTVAIDLEPPREVRRQFGDIPNPGQVFLSTPFWMAYYDDAENYMYVHSIESLGGKIVGTIGPIERKFSKPTGPGATWRSWRMLESEDLSELHIVMINHGALPGRATVGVYIANSDIALYERELEFAPRELHRVVVPREVTEKLATGDEPAPYLQVGADPLLTSNGKPYVLLRYGNGPLSLHHG